MLGLRSLHKTVMELYYRWAAGGGVIRVEVRNVAGQFYVRDPEELRELEGATITSGTSWSERRVLESFIDFLRIGDTVYDVGANVGLYSILLGKAVGDQGQVVAFEPDRRNCRRLQENMKLNRLVNVRCFCRALGDRNGMLPLYLGAVHPSCSSLFPRSDIKVAAQELVQVVEGDHFRDVEDLPVPRAIKIDVEGAECAVLRGLRNTLTEPACRLVFCEVHPELLPPGGGPEQVVALLRSFGFDRIDNYPRGFEQHVFGYKSHAPAG